MPALGIDAGGSSAGWLLLADDGTELARGREGAVTGHVFTPEGSLSPEGEASGRRLRSILAEAGTYGPIDSIVLGATGLEKGSRSARHFEALLSESGARATVLNDMDVAYHTIFQPGEGVLLYGGTGSVAWHIPRSGDTIRIGGHGYLIDDAGGGYFIGRLALQRVLRWHDEQGAPSGRPLAREVYAQLGASDWDSIREEIYVSGRSRVAGLARAVARAADRGDEAAMNIQREAGFELARLANVALARLGAMLPVAVAGGVLHQGAVLLDAITSRLPAGTEVRQVTEDPATGAARLALGNR